MVARVMQELKVSERRACRVLGQARSTQRRRPKVRDDEDALTRRIIELAGCGLLMGPVSGSGPPIGIMCGVMTSSLTVPVMAGR